MDARKTRNFIEAWGAVGAMLGFNASTARVHALLIACDEAISLDDIATRLQISRGNASMCLKELRAWGVIHRMNKAGDRRDYYASEGDIWKMAFSIVRERKRREFDPAVAGVRKALEDLDAEEGEAAERLRQMEGFLSTLEDLGGRLLADEGAAFSLLKLLGTRPG
jgi:DNA-binding transcriptional regulator GbsR (MarR family)